MARVTYGDIITDIAGSIGGVTFQRNASGPIIRLKPSKPVIPSIPQQGQNRLMSELVKAWHSLTLTDQNAWNDFAALHPKVNEYNETKTLNGFQWFLSCNLNRLIIGQDVISTPPTWSVIAPFPAFTITLTSSQFIVVFQTTQSLTGLAAVFYTTPPLRTGNYMLRKNTYMTRIIVGGTMTVPELQNQYSDVFGIQWNSLFATADARIVVHIKKIEIASGLSSPFVSGIASI